MGEGTAAAVAAKTAPEVELTGAEMVVRALKDHGVQHIFGYPGGAVPGSIVRL